MVSQDHGYIFEVPANADSLIEAKPLKDMGRFNHEAACVDPKTGIVYLTEDRGDSLLYRFVPKEYGNLAAGGQLEALVVKDKPQFDTRNWNGNTMTVATWFDVEWVALDNPQSLTMIYECKGMIKVLRCSLAVKAYTGARMNFIFVVRMAGKNS